VITSITLIDIMYAFDWFF